MKHITSIHDIADHYDAFLIDLWGVMHDGMQLYSGAAAAIDFLHAAGKQVVFLSNAPRRTEKPLETLLAMGIQREQFVALITSGQVAHDALRKNPSFGHAYYYLGPSKDEDILHDLEGFVQVSTPQKADFILNTGFEADYQPEAEIEPLLRALVSENLPLLCVNPDIEVVKQDGTRLLCAGWVARRYEQLGGRAEYVGKPHTAAYEACYAQLAAPLNRRRVLAIGDNLLTDIRGANDQGIDSLLITGGILKSEQGSHPSSEQLAALCIGARATPTYVAELFYGRRWRLTWPSLRYSTS